MGLDSKQYLRYVKGQCFGVIGCGRDICFITKRFQAGKFVAVAASDNVIIWELRRNVKILTLNCSVKGTVTAIEIRPISNTSSHHTHLAVGYSDGTLAVFDLEVGEFVKFSGHSSGISSICWDSQGMRVASASQDGEIVVWDVVSERGMVRLLGHKGRVNKISFLQTKNHLVSAGKDTTIKFYDLETNHCYKTISPYESEIIDFVLIKDDTRLITAMANEGLIAAKLVFRESIKEEAKEKDDDVDLDNEEDYLELREMGRIMRSKEDKIQGLKCDGRTLACYGKSRNVDFYLIRNDKEISTKREKKLQKLQKRAREAETKEEEVVIDQLELSFEIKKFPTLKLTDKISCLSLLNLPNGLFKICVLNVNNKISFYQSVLNEKSPYLENTDGYEEQYVLDRPGHRSEVRCVSFNSIGDQVISASGDSIKVWHRTNGQCTSSVASEYALSLIIPPGDRHAIIGTKAGFLQLYDLNTGILLENVKAHRANEKDQDTGIYSLCISSDAKSFVSGGSDHMVKFWNFELVPDEANGRGNRLSFCQDGRVLKVADSVTCVRCSKDGRFLAVATLDLKETIFYMDTLKLMHELYGKALPATCIDFSYDGTIVATGSVDSIVRIFGTDFGDMKKMLKGAHEGGVTDLKFLANTHMFFTCGHDGLVKQWDADNFQRIITLEGHLGLARCLAICPKGAWIVTSGKDFYLRLWNKTHEPLILSDEREQERQKAEEDQELGIIQRPAVPGEKNATAIRPAKSGLETERAADQLLEAISIFREQIEGQNKGVPNQLMSLVYKTDDPYRFVLLVLRKIKSSELEEAIIMLPYNRVLELLIALKGIVDRDWDIELSSRVLIVAVRMNFSQLVATQSAIPILTALAKTLPKRILQFQEMIGLNCVALSHMKSRYEERQETRLFVEAATKLKQKKKKIKNKARVIKRTLMTL